MRKESLMACALLLTLSSCGSSDDRAKHNRIETSEDVDNTGRNVRDRTNRTITPGDQLENEADRTITQNIRKALTDDDSLSTNAKNVKIVTINGVVTLRGVVESGAEKDAVEQKAASAAGIKRVDNQLEIKQRS